MNSHELLRKVKGFVAEHLPPYDSKSFPDFINKVKSIENASVVVQAR